METKNETKECPFCKEDIKSEAIKCKHCSSAISPEKPAHEGTCPYCKEDIKKDAVKCKHCKSDLKISDCGCNEPNVNFGSGQNLLPRGYQNVFRRMGRTMAIPGIPTGQGQECFYECRDMGDGHGWCEFWCQISMPENQVLARN